MSMKKDQRCSKEALAKALGLCSIFVLIFVIVADAFFVKKTIINSKTYKCIFLKTQSYLRPHFTHTGNQIVTNYIPSTRYVYNCGGFEYKSSINKREKLTLRVDTVRCKGLLLGTYIQQKEYELNEMSY